MRKLTSLLLCTLALACAHPAAPPTPAPVEPGPAPTEATAPQEQEQAARQEILNRLIALEKRARQARLDGHHQEALDLYLELLQVERLPMLGGLYAQVRYEVARAQARLGRRQEALDALTLAAQEGFTEDQQAAQEEAFAAWRQEEPFQSALREMRLNQERLKVYAITRWDNPDLSQAHQHHFDSVRGEQAQRLRQLYGLDKLVQGAQSQLEAQRAVMAWVHERWRHNGLREPSAPDALTILAEVEEAGGFRCVEYSIVLAQALNALGFPARVLWLRSQNMSYGVGRGHVVTEAWNHELQKWLVLDGQNNALWTHEGEPLSAAEVQARLQQGLPVQMSHQGSTWKDPAPAQSDWQPYFHYVGLRLDNRIFDQGGGPAAPPHLLLRPGQAPELLFQGSAQKLLYTRDAARLYPTLGQVHAQPVASQEEPALLTLELSHNMPAWSGYLINGEPWQEHRWRWRLKPGANRLEIRARDSSGHLGAPTLIELTYHPPRPKP